MWLQIRSGGSPRAGKAACRSPAPLPLETVPGKLAPAPLTLWNTDAKTSWWLFMLTPPQMRRSSSSSSALASSKASSWISRSASSRSLGREGPGGLRPLPHPGRPHRRPCAGLCWARGPTQDSGPDGAWEGSSQLPGLPEPKYVGISEKPQMICSISLSCTVSEIYLPRERFVVYLHSYLTRRPALYLATPRPLGGGRSTGWPTGSVSGTWVEQGGPTGATPGSPLCPLPIWTPGKGEPGFGEQ